MDGYKKKTIYFLLRLRIQIFIIKSDIPSMIGSNIAVQTVAEHLEEVDKEESVLCITDRLTRFPAQIPPVTSTSS